MGQAVEVAAHTAEVAARIDPECMLAVAANSNVDTDRDQVVAVVDIVVADIEGRMD